MTFAASEDEAKPDATAEDDGSDDREKRAGSDGDEAVSAAAEQLAELKVDHEDNVNSDAPNIEKEKTPELWKPHPPTEDCPVCFVPLPLELTAKAYFSCCGKMICRACVLESDRALKVRNEKRSKKEGFQRF